MYSMSSYWLPCLAETSLLLENSVAAKNWPTCCAYPASHSASPHGSYGTPGTINRPVGVLHFVPSPQTSDATSTSLLLRRPAQYTNLRLVIRSSAFPSQHT